jgi:hypothetical protein
MAWDTTDPGSENAESPAWEPIAIIPDPLGPKIALVALVLLAISACFDPTARGIGPWMIIGLYGLGARQIYKYSRNLCKNAIEVQTDGVRLRVKWQGLWCEVVDIMRLGLVRKGRSWFLSVEFALQHGETVSGDMFPPSRFQIPFTGAREFQAFVKPIVARYGILME